MYRSTATLTCPECTIDLTLVEGDVPLSMCPRCGGAWIDAQPSVTVLQGKADPSEVQRRSKPPSPRSGPERSRPCARCSEAMLPYPFGDVMLDTCPAHGTWFDHDEIERVVKAARKSTTGPSFELPSGEDVWATAKFTAGMIIMPIEAVVNALASLAGYVGRRRSDDDY